MSSEFEVIRIDTNINDEPWGFGCLFDIQSNTSNFRNRQVRFDFTGCSFLTQNVPAFLWALGRILQKDGNQLVLLEDTVQPQVLNILKQNQFLSLFGIVCYPRNGTSISVREDRNINDVGFTEYLLNQWLVDGRVHFSDALKDYITSPVVEAYTNVFDHAQSPVGVVTCGQYYPMLKLLKLTLVDMGVGIPYNVRNYLSQPAMSSRDALQWAFETGSTTKRAEGIGRGLGLKMLKSFMELNDGKLEIYSEDGYVCIDRKGESFTQRGKTFSGTIVQVTIKCDEMVYHLPDEEDYDSGEYF